MRSTPFIIALAAAVGAAGAFTLSPSDLRAAAHRPAGAEIVELRSPEARHFSNGNGTVTTVIEAEAGEPRSGVDVAASLQATFTGYSELGYVYGSLNDSNRGVGGQFYCGYYDLFGLVTVLERGWVEWNVSSIPDTATISSVRCSTYCLSTTGIVTGLAYNHMTSRPSTTPGVSLLYNDAGSGPAYGARANPTAGWLVDSLNSAARDSLDVRLAADWFAVGYSCTGTGNEWEIAFNGTGTTSGPPRLVVTWGTSSTLDVGVSGIVAPTGTIDSTQSVAPACTVANYGSAAAGSFLVRCRVGGFYSDTARVAALPVGGRTLVTFPSRSAWPRGRFVVACSTELAGDAAPSNNRRADSVTVRVLDALPTAIVAPAGTVDSGTAATPQATVRNASSATAVVPVRMTIGAWTDSTAVSLAPDSSATVAFAQWTAGARGTYPVTCVTLLAGDLVPANDTVSGSVAVTVTDAACTGILAPAGTINPGTVAPRATLRNLGTTRTAVTVSFAIGSSPAYYELLDLPAGLPAADTTLEFPAWTAAPGSYACRCSVAAPGDLVPANDTLGRGVTVRASALPPGWVEVAQLPLPPTNKAIKDGAWVVHEPLLGGLHVAKGNKTLDHYTWLDDGWHHHADIPLGREMKPPYKGSAAVGDGDGRIYATKGNNTIGFFGYSADRDSWYQLADVPLGLSNKKVKGGTDLVYVPGDTDYVYLLKGYKAEFYRYDIAGGTWQALSDAPAGAKPKWDRGSWLAYDEARGRLLAHKAKYQELYAYDLLTHTWSAQLPGVPLTNSQTGKNKKSKDGGDAAILDGTLYALKGGNTVDFYAWDLAAGTWSERETIPSVGTTGRKKRVKGGGSITSDGTALYALKGNKTLEVWRYVPGAAAQSPTPSARIPRQGEQGRSEIGNRRLDILLNPAIGRATIRWAGPSSLAPGPSTLSLYDTSGRLVLRRTLDNRQSSLDIPLSPGVYLLRVTGGANETRKLVIE